MLFSDNETSMNLPVNSNFVFRDATSPFNINYKMSQLYGFGVTCILSLILSIFPFVWLHPIVVVVHHPIGNPRSVICQQSAGMGITCFDPISFTPTIFVTFFFAFIIFNACFLIPRYLFKLAISSTTPGSF